MEAQFIIPLNGLASGETKFSWDAGVDFFRGFENTEMQNADFNVTATVYKAGREINVACHIDGTVTVLCDRCMEDLEIPVNEDIDIEVKYGTEEEDKDQADDQTEYIYLSDEDTDLDLRQIIYDYICLSLPMQRFHPDGQCNAEVMKRLQNGVSTLNEEEETTTDNSNPFAGLKGLFE